MTTATLQSGYELILETPSIADYRRLRVASGLSPKSLEAATAGLPNTLFAVVIRKDGEAIGMGRIIDSGLFFQIVDIAVDPAHQGHGLGKAIVATLVEHLHKIALPGAYISLIADGEAHRLYAQYGFQPTAPASIGMYLPTR
jgi:GNAT superfamily N-acetyltransferase